MIAMPVLAREGTKNNRISKYYSKQMYEYMALV